MKVVNLPKRQLMGAADKAFVLEVLREVKAAVEAGDVEALAIITIARGEAEASVCGVMGVDIIGALEVVKTRIAGDVACPE
jgi:hypothetical protein